MKFMEIDEGGFVLHICDDPQLTIIPLVNRVKHLDRDTKQELVDHVGKPITHKGNRWLPPMPISDEDYARLTADGLSGKSAKGTPWHYKYDSKTNTFSKVDDL